ncbi:hypothetical protein VTJ83DRAFT_327 [Remersonia thermophila]|uniref:Yeast cell wall synthesis Kre9/Knh1-like N-terminal domain-containing protein n=1 Tax=Remersonia thermophila TaxID=72144 RepID=A0ABR4DL27_9PEZI
MRFSIASVVAFAAATLAQTTGFHPITKPVQGEEVQAGSTYEIVWLPDNTHPGEITIELLGGATPSTLNIVGTIATGVAGSAGKYSWSVPASLGDLATYGIKISLASDTTVFQYGFPFKIAAVGDETDSNTDDESTTSAAAPTTTTTASSSSVASSTTEASTSTTEASTSTTESSSSTSSTPSAVPSSFLTSSSTESTSVAPSTTFTSVVVVTPTEAAPSSTSPVVTNAAAPLAARGMALLGGLAVAALAF